MITILGYLLDLANLVGKYIKTTRGEWHRIEKVEELFRAVRLTLDDGSVWRVSTWAHVEIAESMEVENG